MINKKENIGSNSSFGSSLNLSDTYNNQVKNININTGELAKSPYGDLELTKYLYESGLQNVFSDYQKSKNMLSQQEQQSLQDAYYIKEMSKKYLGEYASNMGVGDVSGNLLDIYSNYNQNVAGIKANTNLMGLNLEREYQNTRQGYLENILKSQYQIDVAKLQDSERDIMYNLSIGETEGLKGIEYLDKAFKDGKLSKQTYQALAQTIKMQEQTQLKDVMNKQTYDDKGNVIDNPNYIGDDYDFNLNVGNENIDRTSAGYTDVAGNKYFQVKDMAGTQSEVDKGYGVDATDLFEKFKSENNGATPVSGNIIYNDSDGKTVPYIYQGNTWYRLAQEQNITPYEMKNWRIGELGLGNIFGAKREKGANFEIVDSLYSAGKAITINGATYSNGKETFKPSENLTGDQKEIYDMFKQIHTDEKGKIYNSSFIVYKNNVYQYVGDKIMKMKKESK